MTTRKPRGSSDGDDRGQPERGQPERELTFEESLTQLEQVIRELEDGRLGLQESLTRYEEGVRLLKSCHVALNETERKILLLTGVDEHGNPLAVRFDDDESLSLEEKRESRSRRRTSGMTDRRAGRNADAGSEASATPGGDGEWEGDVDRQKGLF